MTFSEPARTPARRTRATVYDRRRRVLLGAVLALLLAAMAFAAPRHPLSDKGQMLDEKGRAYLSPVRWPLRGQAALVLGHGRPAKRAMRFPVFRQIVSMASVTLPVAGTLTNYNPLIAHGYAGKTGSDAVAGARAAQVETLADTGLRCCSLPVAPGHRTDVNAIPPSGRQHE